MKKYLIELDEEKCKRDKSGLYEYIEGKINGNPIRMFIENIYEDIYGRLSIGDYMYDKKTKEIVEVSNVYSLEVMRTFLDPIPISEDILISMGFRNIGNSIYINGDNGILLEFISDGECSLYFINKKIHYINELQNISVVMFNKELKIIS